MKETDKWEQTGDSDLAYVPGAMSTFSTPQLEKIHSGKVRESFRLDDDHRLIVVTDRVSAFDSVLETPVPNKGAVLNSLSNFWFSKTERIVPNHVVAPIGTNATVVREAKPILVEMVVRGYVTGSMWRRYKKGKRNFCGLKIPNGLQKNERLPLPIITPTTKEESDREMTPTELIDGGWVDRATWEEMEKVSLHMFQAGTEILSKRGLILADTKYEFGMVNGTLTAIDEVHTPDSSRMWLQEQYDEDPTSVQQLDKEYVRQWLLGAQDGGRIPSRLPEEILVETSRRYLNLYEMVTGDPLPGLETHVKSRVYRDLLEAGYIKDGYVAIVMGSSRDMEHARRIAESLEQYDVVVDMRVASAHKNGEDVVRIADEYNACVEPGAVIAVAGLSNGLGGALAANLAIPVFNCPPFADGTDMELNINSSLMLPSQTPASTIVRPENAAAAALRALNLHRLRDCFAVERAETKAELRRQDREVRGR